MNLKRHDATRRTIGRLLTLVIIALLAGFLRAILPAPVGTAGGTMLLGFLLLAAFVAGEAARGFRAPRITGYILVGILFGPHVFGILPKAVVTDFRVINGIALSVIALQAGGELRLARLRVRASTILGMGGFLLLILPPSIIAFTYLIQAFVPSLVGQPPGTVLAVASIMALVALALSPATTIAVVTETHSSGPLTDTALGVSVLLDVLVLLLAALVVPLALVLVEPGRGFDFDALREISLLLLASLATGAAVGWLIGQYLARVAIQPVLFVLGMALLIVELGHMIGLEFIVMSMAAGFVVQNYSIQGRPFLEALEANSLPLYALFFSVAGADLDLTVIPGVWAIALGFIGLRALVLYLSTRWAARLVGSHEAVRRYAWWAFLSQAGVALGLLDLVRQRFTFWPVELTAISIAMIAVNQVIGPPLLRVALVRAGETGPGSRRPGASGITEPLSAESAIE